MKAALVANFQETRLPVHYRSVVAGSVQLTVPGTGSSAQKPKDSIDIAGYFFYSLEEMALSLGEFEQIVMLAILRLRDGAYGVSIRAEIMKRTDREPSPGALYLTLDRLEEKGFVSSRLGDPTPQRGGRAKRYFSVTKAGAEAVLRAQHAYRSLLEGVQIPGGAHA
jgi:PadR family transcriptional regulator, regulatory protein PadR